MVVFPNVAEKCAHYLQGDSVIAVSGTLNFWREDEAPSLLADNVLPLLEAAENGIPAGFVRAEVQAAER